MNRRACVMCMQLIVYLSPHELLSNLHKLIFNTNWPYWRSSRRATEKILTFANAKLAGENSSVLNLKKWIAFDGVCNSNRVQRSYVEMCESNQ